MIKASTIATPDMTSYPPNPTSELCDTAPGRARVFTIATLPRELAEAIASSNMDAKHDHLNRLLDEQDPQP